MWEGAYDLDLSRGSTNFAAMKPLSKLLTLPAAYVVNVALAFAVMMIGRIAYLAENFGHFAGEFTHGSLGTLVGGSLLFDASAIAYIYAPYTLLMLLPLAVVATPRWQRSAKYYYVSVTLAALALNLMDAVYFRYTLRRTTSTVFSEFAAEGNLFSIIGWELLRHWYFIALAAAVGFGLWKLYRQPRVSLPKPRRRFYFVQSVALLVAAFLTVVAIRGGVKHSIRPITVSNAAQFVAHPADAALVLNTPFSLIRTIGKDVYQRQSFYPDDLIESIYTPLHRPAPADTLRCRRNVVVIIVESFGREYIGAFNRDLEGGRYRGYTPFVDSLIDVSTTYRWSFCNGRKSIDGMPSILSGVPMMVEPYILTPQSMNTLSGLAGYLAPEGYYTAFFHGADNQSMGFQAFARSTGFGHYFGRTEYDADPLSRGAADFDGWWAIWDEPFLQFFKRSIDTMPQPFVATVFTASSHHPFNIPEEYADRFPEGPLPIHKCIRYTDYALRRFFDEASRQPWFSNTLFVITSDHTNMSDHPEYSSDIGSFSSPIIFYDPTGTLPAGRVDAVAQHIDILPTVLSYLGYGKPYVAFGCDLLSTPPESTWAVNYINGTYQYVKYGYVLQFDGHRPTALYALSDRRMSRNLLTDKTLAPVADKMTAELKAIVQQYMNRMLDDRLTP